jgi:hypothetical protein
MRNSNHETSRSCSIEVDEYAFVPSYTISSKKRVCAIEEHIIHYMSILVHNTISTTQVMVQMQCASKSFQYSLSVGTQKLHENLRKQCCPFHVETYVHYCTQSIGKRNCSRFFIL